MFSCRVSQLAQCKATVLCSLAVSVYRRERDRVHTYHPSGGEPEDERGGDGAEQLRGPVDEGADEADPAGEQRAEGDGRVDVTAGGVGGARHGGGERESVRERHHHQTAHDAAALVMAVHSPCVAYVSSRHT